MIYIQLTDRCNMTCEHCCFSCTGKGSYMAENVFQKALSLAVEYGWSVTLGGGEPTLHPKCLDWVMTAALATIDASMDMDGPAVLVVTNGKKKDIALKLAKLAHLGTIQCDLSQDEWHDPIDPSVVREFSRYSNREGRSHAGIRDVTGGVKDKGRAAENCIQDQNGCCCSALFIAPNGDFYHCGCKKTKIGNILTDEIPARNLESLGECEDYLNKNEEVYA